MTGEELLLILVKTGLELSEEKFQIGAVTASEASGHYEARGNSLESPSVSLCSEQNNSSSLSPPSPLQTMHGGWGASHFSSGGQLGLPVLPSEMA